MFFICVAVWTGETEKSRLCSQYIRGVPVVACVLDRAVSFDDRQTLACTDQLYVEIHIYLRLNIKSILKYL